MAQTGQRMLVERSPSPVSSPPRRGFHQSHFLVLRMTVRPIPSLEISKTRRTILLLLGEKAGMREVQIITAHWQHRRCEIFVEREPTISPSSSGATSSEYAAPTELVNILDGLIYKYAAPLALSHGTRNSTPRRKGAKTQSDGGKYPEGITSFSPALPRRRSGYAGSTVKTNQTPTGFRQRRDGKGQRRVVVGKVLGGSASWRLGVKI